MGSIKETLKRLASRTFLSKVFWGIFMLVLGGFMFWLLAFSLSPFSPMTIYPAAILRIYVGILALVFVDKVIHAKINTYQAILNKNTAYSVTILAYALVIGLILASI